MASVIDLGWVDELDESVEMVLVDDLGVLWGVFGVLVADDVLGELLEELWEYGLVYVEVVGGNACLPCIEKFAPYDAFGCDVEVGIWGDDDWGFASEFECDGGKGFGGCLVNDVSDLWATCEKDFVEVEL